MRIEGEKFAVLLWEFHLKWLGSEKLMIRATQSIQNRKMLDNFSEAISTLLIRSRKATLEKMRTKI